MKTTERILLKAAVIQFLFLLLSQFILHQSDAFSKIKLLTKYEGVVGRLYTNITEK